MKPSLLACALLVFTLTACKKEEPAPAPVAPPSQGSALPSMTTPTAASATPAPIAPTAPAVPEAAAPDISTYGGESEAEKLTWALRAYYDDPNRPKIESLDTLVKTRYLKSVPPAPQGKKWVIDWQTTSVKLETAK